MRSPPTRCSYRNRRFVPGDFPSLQSLRPYGHGTDEPRHTEVEFGDELLQRMRQPLKVVPQILHANERHGAARKTFDSSGTMYLFCFRKASRGAVPCPGKFEWLSNHSPADPAVRSAASNTHFRGLEDRFQLQIHCRQTFREQLRSCELGSRSSRVHLAKIRIGKAGSMLQIQSFSAGS